MLTNDRIEKAFSDKAAALQELYDVNESLLHLKNARAVELAQKVEAGLYEGCKNEDQRKAAAALAFQATDALILSIEKQERETRLALELAKNEVNMLIALIRVNDDNED